MHTFLLLSGNTFPQTSAQTALLCRHCKHVYNNRLKPNWVSKEMTKNKSIRCLRISNEDTSCNCFYAPRCCDAVSFSVFTDFLIQRADTTRHQQPDCGANVLSPVHGTVVCPECCQPCPRYRCLSRMLSALSTVPLSVPNVINLSTVPLSVPNVVSPVHGTVLCPECCQPCPRYRCLS